MVLEFDYEKFALDMYEQSKNIMPKDLIAIQKNYVSNIIFKYTKRAGEALSKENDLKLSTRQKMLITQVISEWTFHKSIDSLRAGIPSNYIDCLIENIACIIFEVAKRGCLENIGENTLLRNVEQKVKKAYKEKILELQKSKSINYKIVKNALQQSNINRMFANETSRGWTSAPK